jgi:hypothetical protein
MTKPVKVLIVVMGLGIGTSLATMLLGGRHRQGASSGDDSDQGPCAVPAGFTGGAPAVSWNPISAPGRCAPTSTKLIVDNGTAGVVQVALGPHTVDVASGAQLAITTLPGRFELHARRGGAPLDDATLALAQGKTYLYNPNAAYDYVIHTREYGSGITFTAGGHPDRPLAPAVLIDPGPVDYVLQPLPDSIQVEHASDQLGIDVATETRTAIAHEPARGLAEVIAHGALRTVAAAHDHVLALSPHPAFGELASIYVDNPDAHAPLVVSLDGAEVMTVDGGAYARLDVEPGRHQLDAHAGDAIEHATLEPRSRERWVWSPGGRRAYTFETVQYGMSLGGGADTDLARGLVTFRVTSDFVFDAPAEIQGGQLDVQLTRTVIRRGKVGDYHAAIAREVAALAKRSKHPIAAPDPATANECDLLAAKAQVARDDAIARAASRFACADR